MQILFNNFAKLETATCKTVKLRACIFTHNCVLPRFVCSPYLCNFS